MSRVEPDGIVVKTKSGVSKLYFTELPKDIQARFHYVDSAKIDAEPKVVTDKERTNRQQEAEAILTKAVKQFQTAETQAAYVYERSDKGTLSGQVFIATRGAENMKLGAVSISLFAGDAIDELLSELSAFAAAKSKLLQLDIAVVQPREQQATTVVQQAQAAKQEAEARERKSHELIEKGFPLSEGAKIKVNADKEALREATAALNTARAAAFGAHEEVKSLLAERAYYHSQPFYFSYLWNPIQIAETDAEGKFVIQLPLSGGFVIAAQGGRITGNGWESYYWLQPVSLNGQRQGVQNLSNSNVMLIPGSN